MRPRLFRTLAPVALLTAAALATLPGRAADATRGPALPRTEPQAEMAAEVWRLRSSQGAAPLPSATDRGRPAAEIPEARRNVRMVYPALVEAR